MDISTNTIKLAIALERKRHQLAEKKNFSKLLSTYKNNQPEIPNLNTGNYWNHRNFEIIPTKKSYPMGWEKTRIIAKWVLSTPNVKKVLNIGFGTGVLEDSTLTKSKKFDWHGIDISKSSVEYVSKKYPESTFLTQEITNIKFNDSTFDLIVASEVLEHISPSTIFSALSEINRVLKDKGHFILSIPINEGLEQYLLKGENPIQHVRMYTPELISIELNIKGFKVQKKEFLYAFHTNYHLKTFITKLFRIRNPNNLILDTIKLSSKSLI